MSVAETHPLPLVNWNSLIGHQHIESWFASAIKNQRLAGSFLFVGPPGNGKRTTANLLARTLLCTRSPALDMNPCGTCESCQQVIAGSHPDLVRVSKPSGKSAIPLDSLIGPPDARMQEGFCRDIRLRPMQGDRKVAILEDADFLNEEGANCLLKTLEEPPSGAIIMLIGTSEQRQLPTIRSRCQIIRFGPLATGDATELLRVRHGVDQSEQAISKAVEISGGDIEAASRLLIGDGDELRQQMVTHLSAKHPDPVVLSRWISKHVEGAGKDASVRRDAMRDVFAVCVQHFRGEMRDQAFAGQSDPKTLTRLDRSIRALREVDRNANQSTLIECFSADIASATTGDRGGIG